MFWTHRTRLCLTVLVTQALAVVFGDTSGIQTWGDLGGHYQWKDTFYISEYDTAYVGLSSDSIHNYRIMRTTVKYLSYTHGAKRLKLEVDFFKLGNPSELSALSLDCSSNRASVWFDFGELTGHNVTWCGTLHAQEHIFPTDVLNISYWPGIFDAPFGGGFAFRVSPVSYSEVVDQLQVYEEPRLLYSHLFPKRYDSFNGQHVTLYAQHKNIHVKALYMDLGEFCHDFLTIEDLGWSNTVQGPYCYRELFWVALPSDQIVVNFKTSLYTLKSGFILAYWSEPSADTSSDNGGQVTIPTMMILVGGSAAVVYFIVLAYFLVRWRLKHKKQGGEAWRLLRQEARSRIERRRHGRIENPVYTIEPQLSADCEPPPPYPGFDITDNDEDDDQTDIPDEAPPPYEELNPQTLPQRCVEQATNP